jgi:hypothetical protein
MNPKKIKLHQFPIEAAIVVFENPKARDVCLKAYAKYSPYYQLNCFRKVPLKFLFRGHYHLHLRKAPEPNAIYWENYNQAPCK